MSEFRLALEPDLSATEFIDILQRSTLAHRRPVDDQATIEGMLKHADVIAVARDSSDRLVGVARAITDFHYCTYLSDLAVAESVQRRGLGKRLIQFSHHAAGLHTTLILLAAPAAVGYYAHIGMTQHDSCWIELGKDRNG